MNEIDKLKENDAKVEKVEQEVLTKLTKLYQECMELNKTFKRCYWMVCLKVVAF